VSLESEVARATADPSRRIGRFVVLDELGRGGMGVVYRAFDPTVRRQVAIKVLRPDVLPGAASEGDTGFERFQREVQTVGRLRHPSIVSLLEAGSHEGKPYLAMDFVEGEDLSVVWRRTRITPRQSAVVLCQIAEAVAYAHGEGVLHRDLKPENVLLDAEGRGYLLDFGLARDLDEVDRLTKTGAVVGTPYFLAPELLSRSSEGSSERSDVYGLGGLLYFCLVGVAPFQGDSVVELLGRVASGDPTPPSKIDPQVHIDLETIALRCLEVDPRKRYASAEGVAAELKRFLAGEAIEARPPGARERLVRWARRRRALALTLVLFVFSVAGLLTAGVIGAAYSVREIAHERGVAERESQRARSAEEVAKKAAEVASQARGAAEKEAAGARRAAKRAREAVEEAALAQKRVAIEGLAKDRLLAEGLLAQGRFLEARRQYDKAAALFARSLELEETPEARSGVVRLLPRLSSTSWASPLLRFFAVAWHPSGASLALASSSGQVFLVDKTGKKVLRRLEAHEGWVTCVAFGAPDELVSAGDKGVIRRWDLNQDRPRVIGTHEGAVSALAARADGLVVSGGLDGVIRLGAPGEKSRVLARHPGPVLGVTFAGPQRVASCGSDGTLRVWALDTGALLNVVQAHRGATTALAYTPRGGGRFATGGADQEVRLWDADLKPGAVLPRRQGVVSSLRFGPKAKRLAWATLGGTAWVHDLRSGRDVAVLTEHEGPLFALAFSPDGASLATASADCTARVFDTLTGQGQTSFSGQSRFRHMGVNAKGVVTLVDGHGRVTRRSVRGQSLGAPRVEGKPTQVAELDATGRWLAASLGRDLPSRYDLETGKRVGPWDNWTLAIRSDGAALIGSSVEGEVSFLRLVDGTKIPLPLVADYSVFDTGGWAAIEGEKGQVYVIDPQGKGQLLRQPEARSSSSRMALSSMHGSLLRSSSSGLEFWDTKRRRLVRTLRSLPSGVACLHIDATGRAATGHYDGSVRVWDLQRGELLQSIAAHSRAVVALSSHKGALISCGEDRQLRVWTPGSPPALERALSKGEQGGREGLRISTLLVSSQGVLGVSSGLTSASASLWEPKKGWRVLTQSAGLGAVLLLSPDGRRLAFSNLQGKGIEVRTFPFAKAGDVTGGKAVARALAFRADGELLLVSSLVKTWLVDVSTGDTRVLSPPQGARAPSHGQFLPSGDIVAPLLVSGAIQLTVFSSTTGKVLRAWPRLVTGRKSSARSSGARRRWRGRRARGVKALALAGDTLAMALEGGGVHFWDAKAGRPRAILVRPDDKEGMSNTLCLSPDGSLLVTNRTWKSGPRVWDTRSARLLLHLEVPGAVAFDARGETLYRYSSKAGLQSWKVADLLADRAQLVEAVWRRTGLLVSGLNAERFEKPIQLARRGARLTQRWLPK
jgi:WD40 repeat protein